MYLLSNDVICPVWVQSVCSFCEQKEILKFSHWVLLSFVFIAVGIFLRFPIDVVDSEKNISNTFKKERFSSIEASNKKDRKNLSHHKLKT
jgi:hypothetical protein